MSDFNVHERLEYDSSAEEYLNRISHDLGVLLSLMATVTLLLAAGATLDPWWIASCAVVGFSLLIFYLSSTLYHTVQRVHPRCIFRILDHATIFVLAAVSVMSMRFIGMSFQSDFDVYAARNENLLTAVFQVSS